MNKLVLYTAAFISLTVGSCDHPHQEAEVGPPVISHVEVKGDVSGTKATLSIEGMTCAEGCGGKIRQELEAIAGVTSTDLNYQEGRAANEVSVSYDPQKVSEHQLIQCVNQIADGKKYHVLTVEIATTRPSGSESTPASSGADGNGNMFGEVFRFANLLNSLSGLLR